MVLHSSALVHMNYKGNELNSVAHGIQQLVFPSTQSFCLQSSWHVWYAMVLTFIQVFL